MSSTAGTDKIVNKAAQKEMTRFLKDERDRAKGYVPETLGKDEVMEKYGLDKKQYKSMRKQFNEERKQLVKEVQRFTSDIWALYGNGEFSYEALLKQARDVLDANPGKYNITSNGRKFHLFAENLLQLIDSDKQKLIHGGRDRSEVSRKLGRVNYPGLKPGKFEADDADKAVLEQIRTIAETNVPFHAASVSQNIQYGDGTKSGNPDNVVDVAEFNQGTDVKSCHAHPLLVAMFAPNIPALEDRFLNTFMAGIIRDRMLNHSVRSRQDFELYMDLTQDRNDSICSAEGNVFLDLLRRVNMQELLRRSVFHMRNGRFFACDAHAFLKAVDSCRQSPFDAPHLMYTRDEATILRRLCNAFAYRPTRVSTHALHMAHNNPAALATVHPLTCIQVMIPAKGSPRYLEARNGATANNAIYSWDTNHMWKRRLANGSERATVAQLTPNNNDPTSLSWFVQNGVAMPRNQNILYTRNVIFFYVNRRHFTTFGNQTQYFFDRLPLSVAGLQHINDYPVAVPEQLDGNQGFTSSSDNDNRYWLRSAVCVRPAPSAKFGAKSNGAGVGARGNQAELFEGKYAAGSTAVVVKRDGTDFQSLVEYDPWKINAAANSKVFMPYATGDAAGAPAGDDTATLAVSPYDTYFTATHDPSRDGLNVDAKLNDAYNVGVKAQMRADNQSANPVAAAADAEGDLFYSIGYKLRHFGTIFIYSREVTQVGNPFLKNRLTN